MAKKSNAMQRRPRFNPTEYREDFTDLIKTNPALAADAATKLARRKINADMRVANASETTQDLFAFLGTTVVMAIAGWWNGDMMAKRNALIADWETEGASAVGASTTEAPAPWDHPAGVSDPTSWGWFPKLALLPIGASIVAVIAATMRSERERPSGFERWATMTAGSTFGLVVANGIAGWAYDRKERMLAQSPNIDSIRPANGGVSRVG